MPMLEVAGSFQDVAILVVATGSGQSTARELTASDNEITVAATGAGVVLSSKIAPGDTQFVYNGAATAFFVYPPSGMRINALATNVGVTLAADTSCFYKCISTTRIFKVLSA